MKLITYKNKRFNDEITNSPESRQLGLMYRESMPDEDGMLFVFDKMGTYSFWMKNTLISDFGLYDGHSGVLQESIWIISTIFKSESNRIHASEAKYVLEINQGLISEKGLLHIGDECELIN